MFKALKRSVPVAVRRYTNWPFLKDDHRMLAEMCRNFADTELAPIAGSVDKEHRFPKPQIDKLGELGQCDGIGREYIN